MLLSVSEPLSRSTIDADVSKKLSAKYKDFSFRIDQKSFGQVTLVNVRVRLEKDQKSSMQLWYAYKETASGVRSWDLT